MTLSKRWQNLKTGFISFFFVALLRLWSASWRKDDTELAYIDSLLNSGERLLFVFWHGKYLPLFTLLEGRNMMVFSSQSFRGEIIENICRRFGYASIQIPKHEPGEAYPFVKGALQLHNAGALVLDGPLGPYHDVKSGALRLASDLGFLLVPVSLASHPKLIMAGRWDKRELPHLFAKVVLCVGEPIHVPNHLSGEDISEWGARLRATMEKLDRKAEERLS